MRCGLASPETRFRPSVVASGLVAGPSTTGRRGVTRRRLKVQRKGYAMSRHAVTRSPTSRPPEPQAGELGPSVPLTSLLETWVADQLITPEQADRILVRGDVVVQAPPAVQERPHERSSLVIEALGYLGGVIILVASILIASLYWDQVGTAARLVIVGGVAAVLLAAGFAIPERLEDVGIRLRSVLWLLSTGAFAGFLGLLGADALNMAGKDVFLLIECRCRGVCRRPVAHRPHARPAARHDGGPDADCRSAHERARRQ